MSGNSIYLNQLGQLFILLDEVANLLSDFSGGYSNDFLSAEEFHEALVASVVRLKEGNLSEIRRIHFWFLPACEWDDFTGKEGQALGNSISQLLSTLQKSVGIYH